MASSVVIKAFNCPRDKTFNHNSMVRGKTGIVSSFTSLFRGSAGDMDSHPHLDKTRHTLFDLRIIRCSTIRAISCCRDALFNHMWQKTDLPPSTGTNSAEANGNRRPMRPLMFQHGLSRYCTIPASPLQNSYVDYANVFIGMWDILPSAIQVYWILSEISVYGIFCPLK